MSPLEDDGDMDFDNDDEGVSYFPRSKKAPSYMQRKIQQYKVRLLASSCADAVPVTHELLEP